MLEGKKVYIVAIATIIFAISGAFLGKLTVAEAIAIVAGAIGLIGVRKVAG